MNTKKQGDMGVAAAIFYYTINGYTVSAPLTDAARYDLIVDNGSEILRVQCKSTSSITRHGTPTVGFRTKGGNRSGGEKVKTIQSSECDIVFVYVIDGPMYEFPVELCENRNSMDLGKKYAEYAVVK